VTDDNEPLPTVWPFPTYKGRPYKPPRKPKPNPMDYPEALL